MDFDTDASIDQLILLSRQLGSENRPLAILAEGNVSLYASPTTFWIKASGTQLGQATEKTMVELRFEPILQALKNQSPDENPLSDAQIKELLRTAQVDPTSLIPSIETFMHASLLQLEGVRFVAHTHPQPLLSILFLAECLKFATMRFFPDEIVCCGPESVYVPYADPGLPLAQLIHKEVDRYIAKWGASPKTIWLQNHGLIALGSTYEEALSATLMTVKAAQALLGSLSTARPLSPLTQEQIARIHKRPDEHYRQRLLAGNLSPENLDPKQVDPKSPNPENKE